MRTAFWRERNHYYSLEMGVCHECGGMCSPSQGFCPDCLEKKTQAIEKNEVEPKEEPNGVYGLVSQAVFELAAK